MNNVPRLMSLLIPEKFSGGDVLIIDTAIDTDLSKRLRGNDLDVICDFYPSADSWRGKAAFIADKDEAVSRFNDSKKYDCVLLTVPQNLMAAQFKIAQALGVLKESGIFIMAAANDAGGKRLKKLAAETGFFFHEIQKFKGRAVKITKDSGETADKNLQNWLNSGKPQPILGGKYISWPGIYGWDKIDSGSAILAVTLPDGLNGTGADFGCGYGYLPCEVLSGTNTADGLHLIDADARALYCARQNLTSYKAVYLWDDLSKPMDVKKLPRLDWIVMNPPFHQGKATDLNIGISFIENAARFLKTGGMLYMVANRHLAYEDTLGRHFRSVETVLQKDGFKVIHAKR